MTLTEITEVSLPPILCRIPQAAAMIGRGQRFIYEAIATGQIEAVKSDKRTLVLVSSLHKYVEKLKPAKIKPMTRRNPLMGHNKPPAGQRLR
jgi:hypothetical protein